MKGVYVLVPGLNDHALLIKLLYWLAAQRWRMAGMQVIVFSSNWESREGYSAKQKRLGELIARHSKRGSVVLVGVSAGASLATVAFKQHHAHALIGVSGLFKLAAQQWSPAELNTAWHKAAAHCDAISDDLSAAEKRRIMTLTPHRDAVINPRYARLEGVKNYHTRSNGHMGSIVEALLGRVGEIKRFVQELPERS